jgi:hypothetical protein
MHSFSEVRFRPWVRLRGVVWVGAAVPPDLVCWPPVLGFEPALPVGPADPEGPVVPDGVVVVGVAENGPLFFPLPPQPASSAIANSRAGTECQNRDLTRRRVGARARFGESPTALSRPHRD